MANYHRLPHRNQSGFPSITERNDKDVEVGVDAMEFSSLPPRGNEVYGNDNATANCRPPVPRKWDALESLVLHITWKSDKPCLMYPATSLRDVNHPCVLQFAFSSKTMTQFVKYKLKKDDIIVSLKEMQSGRMYLDMTQTTCETAEDVQVSIAEAFGKLHLEDTDYRKFDKGTKNYELLENAQSYDLSNLIENEELMLFEAPEACYMVGNLKDLAKMEQSLGLQKQDKKLVQDIIPWSVLETLQIRQYLSDQNLKIATEIKEEHLTIIGSIDEIERAEKFIRDFSAAITKREVNFKSKHHRQLLYVDGNKRNDHVLAHFEKKMREKKIPCCVEIDEFDGNFFVFVTCIDEKNGVQAEEIISSSIGDVVIEDNQRRDIDTLVDMWKKKNKLKVLKLEGKKNRIICTSDVLREISEELEKRDEVPLPPIISKFLETHGRENLESIGKAHSLDLNIENGFLCLTGAKKDIQKFKEEYHKTYVEDLFLVTVPSDLVRKHEANLSSIANENQCCFQPKYSEEPNDTLLKHCKLVATWDHVRRNEKVTLIAGQIEDVQTDFRILFVTDIQFPLNKFQEKSGISESLISLCKGSEGNKKKIGELLDYTTVLSATESCTTQGIVLTKSNYSIREKSSLNMSVIEAAVLKVLNEALRKKASSIVIPFCLMDEHMPPKMVAKACVRAMMSLPSDDTELHMYLLCGQEENETEMAQIIDDVYQGRKGKGYYRVMHSDDIHFKQGYHKIQLKVGIDSILDVKTDVIVNTVSTNLDLNKGKLSQQILEKGGEEIQKECFDKYPGGIKHGQLAITSAGNLKSELIFHCALPSFDKTHFYNAVKSMVWRCLLEMDINSGKKIAFPAFGTGKLGYPVRETAKAMFDAVEEYQICSINSSVKKVVFVMVQGDACDVFCQEEKNRKSKRTKDISGKGAFPSLNVSVGFDDNVVELKVVRKRDLGQLSTSVVQIQYTWEKGEELIELDFSSSAKARGDKDTLSIYMENRNLQALTEAIQELLDYCNKKRILEILIPASKEIAVSALEQIKVVVKVVQEYAKSGKTSRLSNVYIVVPDNNSLDFLEAELNRDERSFASLRNWFTGKRIWRRNTSENLFVEMRVVGNSADSVKKTKLEIMEYLNDAKEDIEADVVNETDEVKESGSTNSMQNTEQEDHVKSNQVDTVSAELNPGIYKFLVQEGYFEHWKSKIQTHYHLGFQIDDRGGVLVEGSFEYILLFEKYLDEEFPKDPGASQEPKYSDHNVPKSTDDDRYTPLQKEQITVKSCKINSEAAQSSNSASQQDKSRTYFDYQGACQTKGSQKEACSKELDIKSHFTVGDLEICLMNGDITTMKVDCIVSSANENLVAFGLAGKIASSAGEDFKDACLKEVKQNGGLKVGDCRLMVPGKLLCEKVMHVMGPVWSVSKSNQHDLLQAMLDVVLRCLNTADDCKFSSVALPLISSGVSKFPVGLLAQQYFRALKLFSQSRKSIRVVYIVEMDRKKMQKLIFEFESQVKVMKEFPCTELHGGKTELGAVIIYSHEKEVEVNMVHGNIASVRSDAVVSPEDRSLGGKSGIAKAIISLGDRGYSEKHANLKKGKIPLERVVGSVFDTKFSGGQLRFQYVLHTIVPRGNKGYCQNASSLEKDIILTVQNVLDRAKLLKCSSVAMPLFGTSEDKQIDTAVETCCKAMVNGITKYLEKNETTLNRIDFVCDQKAVVQAFRSVMENMGVAETRV